MKGFGFFDPKTISSRVCANFGETQKPKIPRRGVRTKQKAIA